MTSTLTERQAIERLMNYNEAERARLYASYETYLDRLRELDEIDRINEQANKVEEVKVETFERPLVTQEDLEAVGKNARDTFEGILNAFNDLKAEFNELKKSEQEEPELVFPISKNLCNEVLQPEPEVDKPKEKPSAGLEPDKLEMRKTLMRGTTNDNKVVAQFAKVILKENVEPMKSKELVKALNDAGIHMNHPNETLRQIRMHDPSIKNVSHGYYQYVK
ncbi:hypothetical protein [Bacillus phage SWEP1]|nr:hypothetical protein [Bacillus phage SWEP1]